jgi:hypothetical protein
MLFYLPLHPFSYPEQFNYNIIDINDQPSCDLLPHFDDCFEFIDRFYCFSLNLCVNAPTAEGAMLVERWFTALLGSLALQLS